MDLSILKEGWVITAAQLLLGKVLKQNPKIANDTIPILIFIAAVLGVGFEITTGQIVAPKDPSMVAATMGAVGGVSTLLAVGVHSICKNSTGLIKRIGSLFSGIFNKG